MKRVVLILLSIIVILFLIWGVDRAIGAGCTPAALGGTGTCTVPSAGELPIGNGSGSYTPATLTPGANIVITNASGSVTIGVTGTATGTVYLLQAGHGISLSPASITSSGTIAVNPSTVIADVVASGQFLSSSTTYVATVNGQSGAVTIGIPATTTVNGTQATVFHLIGDGTTVTSTVNGATTTFSVVTSGNWQGTWQGVNSSTFYKASNPSGYISGNQTITFVAAGDATGTATGTTMISDTMTVTGLKGKALPALATGTLKYSGGAWTFDGNTYLPSGVNVTTTGPLGGGGPLTSAGLTLTCATCLTGNQTITLTGAITGSGTTSIATAYATSTLYALFSGSGPITFNASTGAIGWTNSLNYITGVAVNGQSGTSFSIVAGSGLSSSVSGTTTTLSLSLGAGCTGGNFVQTISATGTITCAIPSGTFTTTTVNGTAALAFILQGDGSTITSTTSGASTTYSVVPGVFVTTASGTAEFYPLTGNPSGFATTTIQSVLNSLSAAGCLTYSTSTGQFTATCLSTSTAATTYVPYTGATGNVNLGSHNLTAAYGLFESAGPTTLKAQSTAGDAFLSLQALGQNESLFYERTATGYAGFTGPIAFDVEKWGGSTPIFFVDSSQGGSNHVGINTSTPQTNFQVVGTSSFNGLGINTTAPLAPLQVSGGTAWGTVMINATPGDTGSELRLGVNNTTTNYAWISAVKGGIGSIPLILNSGNNVGIGGTSAVNTLDVNGSADVSSTLVVGTTTSPTEGAIEAYTPTSFPGDVGLNIHSDVQVNHVSFQLESGTSTQTKWQFSQRGNTSFAFYNYYNGSWIDPFTITDGPNGAVGFGGSVNETTLAGATMITNSSTVAIKDYPNANTLHVNGTADFITSASVGTSTQKGTFNVAGTLNVSQTSTLATTTATTLTVANTGTATTTVIEGSASSPVCNTTYTASGTAVYVDYKASGQELISNSSCQ